MNNASEPTAERRPVILVPYDPRWAEAFQLEAGLISSVLGGIIRSLEHIGSTAIPGIEAKPIIDMMLEVKTPADFPCVEELLPRFGYIGRGEYGIPGRRFFYKGEASDRSHHLHAYATGHADLLAKRLFRDYLIAHREAALEYETLKLELASRYPDQPNAYSEAKGEFIGRILQTAAA